MNPSRRNYLLAEQTTLKRMLSEIPEEAVLERPGLEARLKDVELELASGDSTGRETASAILTFGGRPVVGQHGIFAEFAAKATGNFTDAVAKVAAGLSGPLASMGPIPNREESQLLITGVALGSFGFVLEAAPSEPLLFEERTIADQALELTRVLLQSTQGTDDELADSAAATDPRAVVAVQAFLEHLAANEAVCALRCNDEVFQFKDVGEVARGARRLGRDNLREESTRLVGRFQGVLPEGRSFEFKIEDGSEVIRGKIGPAVPTPQVINGHLDVSVEIDVLATRVGTGRPRYALSKLPEWP